MGARPNNAAMTRQAAAACLEARSFGIVVIVGLAQDFKPVDAQEMRVALDRPPVKIRMLKQSGSFDFADDAATPVDIAGVVDNPIRSGLLVIGFPYEEHRVERLALDVLMKEKQIARRGGAKVARNAISVEPQKRGAVGEFD